MTPASERNLCDEIANEWVQRGGNAEIFFGNIHQIISNIRKLDEIMRKIEVINEDIQEEE